MDSAIAQLLTGELGTHVLLLLFILGILTKRFVPWWIYEEAVDQLKAYEEDAESLLDTIENLIEEYQNKDYSSPALHQTKERARAIRRQRDKNGRRERSQRKRGQSDENAP